MSELISSHHRELYRRYYAARQVEARPSAWLPRIEQLARDLGARSLIDYGCGAARGVSRFCSLPVIDYDPAVPECENVPQACDLVVSIHALEHVEAQSIDAVLDHMRSLARLALFVVVSCEASTKMLPDGSQWHSFVRSALWWRARLHDLEPQATIKDAAKEYAALFVRRP